MGNNITMSNPDTMKVYVLRKAFQKYRYFIDLCESEISGLGKVKKVGDKLIITDFEIFKQKVSGAHSDMDDDALATFLYEKTKAGESLSEWRVWWHSHATMATFFSKTDTDTIDRSTEFPWLISIVGNHAGDIKARIDLFDPVRYDEEVQVEILEEEDPELRELCLKEIKEKVEKYEYVSEYSKGKKDKKERGITHFWGEDDEDEFHQHMRK